MLRCVDQRTHRAREFNGGAAPNNVQLAATQARLRAELRARGSVADFACFTLRQP
jgi:hypothetical protein